MASEPLTWDRLRDVVAEFEYHFPDAAAWPAFGVVGVSRDEWATVPTITDPARRLLGIPVDVVDSIPGDRVYLVFGVDSALSTPRAPEPTPDVEAGGG